MHPSAEALPTTEHPSTSSSSSARVDFSRFLGQAQHHAAYEPGSPGDTRTFKTVQFSSLPTEEADVEKDAEAGEDAGLMGPGLHQHHSQRRASGLGQWSARSIAIWTILSISLLMNGASLLRHAADRISGLQCRPTHPTHFTANATYANVYPHSDAAWAALGGNSSGVIYTSQGQSDGKVRPGGLSMFHQLHCLDSFRHAIQQLQAGKAIGYDEATDVSAHQGHWPHCFDYLRQVLLCHADATVEASWLDDGYRWTIDGYHNTERKCGDSGQLYRMTDCGERGCPGTEHYLSEVEFERVKAENERDAKARKEEDLRNGITREWALRGTKTETAVRAVGTAASTFRG